MLDQIPQPPVDMVMPAAIHGITISTMIVFALIMAWVVRESYKTKSVVPVMIMVGGTVACLNEPIWDILDLVWYAHLGTVPLYRIFNVSVPVWCLFAYPVYLGGLGMVIYRKLSRGMSPAWLWSFYLAGWIANFVLEIPVLQQNVYVYYGPQPFKVLGFPLWQSASNAVVPIVIGAVVYGWREFFKGLRAVLVIPVVPLAQIVALACIGMPTVLALHSGHGLSWTIPASIVSLGLSLMMVYMIADKVCVPAQEFARERLPAAAE